MVLSNLVSSTCVAFFIVVTIACCTNGVVLKSNFTQFGQRVRDTRRTESAKVLSQIVAPPMEKKKQSNDTKSTAASYDSFRVLTPEEEPNGLLLVNSYHDFRRNSNPHHRHHYHGDGYHNDEYHPGYHHHRHHHTHHYLGRDEAGNNIEEASPDEIVDENNEDTDEETTPMDEESDVDSPNSELVDSNDDTSGVDIPLTNSEREEVTENDVPEDAPENSRSSGMSAALRNPGSRPVFSDLPPTHFKCSHVKHPGHYADVEARCQVVLPGNRYGKWEILHFYHKSSPQKSNAVVYLDHGQNSHRKHHHHYSHDGYPYRPDYHQHYPHSHNGYHHRYHHHDYHNNHYRYPLSSGAKAKS